MPSTPARAPAPGLAAASSGCPESLPADKPRLGRRERDGVLNRRQADQVWTSELHHLGDKSGAYGNPGSVMTDMSRAAASRTMTPPDNIWFAHWNGLKNTSDQASYPAFPNSDWNDHQRLHQYEGNLNQAWGGVSISIDAD